MISRLAERALIVFILIAVVQTKPLLAGSGLLQVNTTTNRIVDEDGRERIFHGTNVVYKGVPYHPSTGSFNFQDSFVEEDAQLLHGWGVNAVRLAVMWPGVEPVRGQYNQTYLQIMKGIADLCAKYGIYVLVEMHQDCFSERFCGEGVPEWAVILKNSTMNESRLFPEPIGPSFPSSKNGSIPTNKECAEHIWVQYYTTYALSSAVQSLYENYMGLATSFSEYWKTLAQTFQDGENILGYELMNEPWAGDVFANPQLMTPGVADSVNLQPFYENISQAIRQTDLDRIIFFEGVTWDDYVSGFTSVPGGDVYRNRSALTFHYYVPPNFSPEEQLQTFYKKAVELQTGWFLSETFGGDDLFSEADKYFQSWMYWEYKSFYPITGSDSGYWYPNGTINPKTVYELTRTYARAIAGNGQSMSFDPMTNIFKLSYKINKNCQLPTEIYLYSDAHYPNGVQVELFPENGASWSLISPNEIFIYTTNSSLPDATLLTVTISPL